MQLFFCKMQFLPYLCRKLEILYLMTNKLYFLFVSLLAITISLTAQTYEPLIVSSGFNRDVISERTPYNSYARFPCPF